MFRFAVERVPAEPGCPMAISPLSPLSLHFLGDDGYSLVTQPHIGFAVVLQTTINRSVHAIGIGVHGASKVRMTLRPAPENTGIVFVRADRGDAAIEAKAHWVCDTLLSTSVGEGDLRVATVEHLIERHCVVEDRNARAVLGRDLVHVIGGEHVAGAGHVNHDDIGRSRKVFADVACSETGDQIIDTARPCAGNDGDRLALVEIFLRDRWRCNSDGEDCRKTSDAYTP